MQYSRLGLYLERNIKKRQRAEDKIKKVDYMNIALIILLVIVIIFFFLKN